MTSATPIEQRAGLGQSIEKRLKMTVNKTWNWFDRESRMTPSQHGREELAYFLEVANRAVNAAAEILLSKLGRVEVRLKGHADFVTEADTGAQRAAVEIIHREFPNHDFLGEEGTAGHSPGSPYRWILDPLDGTTNYVHGVPFFAVSLALECEGRPIVGVIYDPMLRERFTAIAGYGARLNGETIRVSMVERLSDALISIGLPARVLPDSPDVRWMIQSAVHCLSIRRTGSAALNMAYLAAGRFDISWALTTKAWDVAAGAILIEEAGGVVSGLDGQPLNSQGGPYIAAANRSLLEQFLAVVGPYRDRGPAST